MIKSRSKKIIARVNNKPLVFVVIIAGLGLLFLAFGGAATSYFSYEAESGSLSGASKIFSDINASDGVAIQFGAVNNSLTIISPKHEVEQIKQEVKSGPKKAYWEYIKSRSTSNPQTGWTPTNWSQNVTHNGYSFSPRTFKSTDHPNRSSTDAQGEYMKLGAINIYTCALRWALDNHTTCGEHVVDYLESWASNFQYAQCRPSGIDVRENQVKLYSGWYVSLVTKAAEIIWDHPSFTADKKQKVADWLWKAFLREEVELKEIDEEVLGARGAGWNGRMLSLQARLNSGLVMKAAGHNKGEQVINDIRDKVTSILPEVLYYGTSPWHESLNQPWPKQPYRKFGNSWAGFNNADTMKSYWFFTDNAPSPPAYFVGQTQETGRDVGHQQMGIGSITEVFRALRLNGYEDKFGDSQFGPILLQMGEKHASIYNEALDEYWAGGYSRVDDLTGRWVPNEFTNRQISSRGNGVNTVAFEIGGESADHGWEFLRIELKSKGLETPELDRLTSRLRGTGSKSSTNAAGVNYVKDANHLAWEPLFGM